MTSAFPLNKRSLTEKPWYCAIQKVIRYERPCAHATHTRTCTTPTSSDREAACFVLAPKNTVCVWPQILTHSLKWYSSERDHNPWLIVQRHKNPHGLTNLAENNCYHHHGIQEGHGHPTPVKNTEISQKLSCRRVHTTRMKIHFFMPVWFETETKLAIFHWMLWMARQMCLLSQGKGFPESQFISSAIIETFFLD